MDALLEYRKLCMPDLERQRPSFIFSHNAINYKIGGHCILIPPNIVSSLLHCDLSALYGKKNLALKIFFFRPLPLHTDMNSVSWGNGISLIRASIIQNVFSFAGKAPKIYDLLFIRDNSIKFAAQVTDYIESDTCFDDEISDTLIGELIQYGRKFGIIIPDCGIHNICRGQLTDFGEAFIDNEVTFSTKIKDMVKNALVFGGQDGIPYQSIEALGIVGKRDNLKREEYVMLDPCHSILDVGCNGAYFLRRAIELGATRAVGVDLESVAEGARWLNNYLGYFPVDFQAEIPDESFDVVLFLSMLSYIPDPSPIFKRVKKTLWFEGHGNHTADEYIPLLKPYFKTIKACGIVNDYPESGPRVILRCDV